MSQKNIVITGASRGIGLELLRVFAQQGHKVLGISRTTSTMMALQKEENLISVLAADISIDADLKAVSSFVEKNWKHVDVLIHNAGKLILKPFKETSTNDFLEVFKVNVFGVAALTRELLPFLKKGSHVVTISSMGGIQGSMKFAGLSAYSTSKGAVITLSELLAEEYKEEGFFFNTLALGAVQTDMLAEAFPGFKAPTTAAEMASYIANFALTGTQFYNGKVLQVSSSTP